tara:strand:+ start:990 stop:1739 length:750 start_codon:yes stop_codon:yes gene_type:complete
MKILVPVKRVIDYNVKVRIKQDCSDVDLSNTKMSINPFCEIAVEEALRLKEAGTASEVIAVCIGPKIVKEQILAALAMGADRAIRIDVEEQPEPLVIARLLAKVAEQEDAGLIMMGKQAIDSDNNQVGQMLAGIMGRPQGTFASVVKIEGDEALVTREVDGGLQTVALKLPAIVTADLRLNEPRFTKLPDIMKAKRKPIAETTAADLGVEVTSTQQQLSVAAPATRQAGIKVASVDEVVDKLKNKAKVI